eukprot:TRINITY_DN49890_c0_g1_i1.p1 TRINITY_DN49890_c0_g1~~TRINITY_DN49890_c0_g1_i1.p1  ORF type:complete len:224 (+),score=75.29 TRINITY_DN49890_c0_g1_i1:93-764(+)
MDQSQWDYLDASEAYLKLHQIHQVWERLTHALVTTMPEDPRGFVLDRLKEELKSRNDCGREVVFLVGHEAAGARDMAERLGRDCGCLVIDGSQFRETHGDDAEALATGFRRFVITRSPGVAIVVHGFPSAIREALVFEIQLAPARKCIYLECSPKFLAQKCALSEADVAAQLQTRVLPLREYFQAKQSLATVNAEQGDAAYAEVKKIVGAAQKAAEERLAAEQ